MSYPFSIRYVIFFISCAGSLLPHTAIGQDLFDYEQPLILAAENYKGEVPEVLKQAEEWYYFDRQYKKVIELLDEDSFDNLFFERYERIAGYRFLILAHLKVASLSANLPDAQRYHEDRARRVARAFMTEFPNYNYEFWNEKDEPFIALIKQTRAELGFVITPNRQWDAPLRAPANVITLSGEEIIQAGYNNLGEVIESMPGFDVINQFSENYSLILPRGFRSETSNRISLMIDGEIQNHPWSGAAYVSNQFPMQLIDRIEIQYGPGIQAYGPGASLGIINIITKSPTKALEYEEDITRVLNSRFMLSRGSYTANQAEAHVSGRLRDLYYSVATRYYWSDELNLAAIDSSFLFTEGRFNDLDYENRLSVRDPEQIAQIKSDASWPQLFDEQGTTLIPNATAIQQARNLDQAAFRNGINGMPVQFTNFSRNWFFNAQAQYKNFSFKFNSSLLREGMPATIFHTFKDEPGRRFQAAGSNNGNNFELFNQSVSVTYEEKTSRSTGVKLRIYNRNQSVALRDWHLTSYGDGIQNGLDLLDNTVPEWEQNIRKQSSQQFGIDAHWMHRIRPGWRYTIDINYRIALMERNYLQFIDLSLNSWMLGLGISNKFLLTPELDLILAARLDYNDVFDSFSFGGFGATLSPKAGLVYHKSNWSLKAIYSRGFQEPSNWIKYHAFRPVGADRTPGINFDQPAELVDHLELNYIRQVRNFFLNTGLFYYQVNNAIILKDYPYEYSFEEYSENNQFRGMGGQLLLGWTGRFSRPVFNLIDQINWTANYSYTFSEQTNDDLNSVSLRVADIAPHRINSRLNILFKNYWNLSFRWSWVDTRISGPQTTVPLNNEVFPAYNFLNTSISYTRNRYTIQLMVNNLLNVSYTHPGPFFADNNQFQSSIPQRDRNFMIRVFVDWQVKKSLSEVK